MTEMKSLTIGGKRYDSFPDQQSRDTLALLPKEMADQFCPPFQEKLSIVQGDFVADYPLSVTSCIEPVQEGSGEPSPENVRPIHGWDKVGMVRCGKNLLDPIASPGSAFDIQADKAVKANSASGATTIAKIHLIAGEKYTFTAYRKVGSGELPCLIIRTLDGEKQFANYGNVNNPLTWSVEKSGEYKAIIQAQNAKGAVTIGDIFHVQIEVNSSSTDYESHNGETYTQKFPETVYGGTYDWKSGKLSSQWDKCVLDGSSDEGWIMVSAGKFACKNAVSAVIVKPESKSTMPYLLCETSPAKKEKDIRVGENGIAINELGWIVYIAAFESVEALKQELSQKPLTIVYKLVTPQNTQLTSHHILSLSGTNTLYSDTGDTEVSGRLDPKTVISKLEDRIAALEKYHAQI